MSIMRYILAIFLFLPLFGFTQNKVEEVRLKSGRVAVLYDNGLWIYKEGSNSQTKPGAAKVNQAVPATRSTNSQTSSPCGARTKTTGAPCRRMVRGGGYCYQHS